MNDEALTHGGQLVGAVLARHGIPFLFTLCGGHISPILVGAAGHGLRVIDVRHEATAVFAADAVARLTGKPGVAAVTAGPGLTNTITAVKNAQMAQSPLLIMGGATATLLKGRGSLQDIDQMALMRPHVKWARSVSTVRELAPVLTEALATAAAGVPGPVFVELPLDLLYPEAVVREWHEKMSGGGESLASRLRRWYIERHVNDLFAGDHDVPDPAPPAFPGPTSGQIQRTRDLLNAADRPVLLVGSQAMLDAPTAADLQAAVEGLGIPTYLSGMARGLLGKGELHMRHKRRQALKEADLVILAGVVCDFRLNYGQHIPRGAALISINRDYGDLHKNCKPDPAILADPGTFLRRLADGWQPAADWSAWRATLAARNEARDLEISADAAVATDYVNPLQLCQAIEAAAAPDTIFIGDGGDFVATASYIVRPRAPLSWLDPGAFGTLGAGAGFALGAGLARPEAEIWLLYGDGSAAYSLAEFDTFSRHGVPVIAVVGNNAGWAQIARDQVTFFGTALGTELAHTDYDVVARGYGGVGLRLAEPADIAAVLQKAQTEAGAGKPVLINALIGDTGFRQGSMSM